MFLIPGLNYPESFEKKKGKKNQAVREEDFLVHFI